MARVVRETHEITTNNDPAEPATYRSTNALARAVYTIAVVIVLLLALRFILALLGANRGNAFTDLIYVTSQPFVAPFFGMFNYRTNYGVSNFEVETLFAIIVYSIIAWAIVHLTSLRETD